MTKLLAIDDKPDNLISIKALLTLLIPESRVITACSGPEGIELATREHPDVILLDIHMPGMDGFEVCRCLKAANETAHIPIIILTAIKTDSKSRVKALELGADAFLGKPLDETELVAQVKVMLRIKQTEDILRRERDFLEESVRQQLKDLQESRDQYQALFEKSNDGIIICDFKGNIYNANKAACKMLDYSKNELKGIQIGSLHPLSELGAMEKALEEGGKQGGCRFESVFKNRQNKLIDVDVSSSIVDDAKGLIQVIIRDISRQKRYEQERKEMSKRIRHSQKMEAIGVLAGGIAHDFNNILFPIVGSVQMLAEDLPRDSTLKHHTDTIYAGTMRARELVTQILTFSRQSDQEMFPMKPHLVVKEVVKLISSTLPVTITIAHNIDPHTATILADPTHFHQIVMNLITNAYHSMEDERGKITITLKNINIPADMEGSSTVTKALKPGPHMVLSISDTGMGMDQDVIQRIFDPYFTTKAPDKGTGLGLSMVHGIVKGYDGEIVVNSIPKEGSTFYVYLPVTDKAFKVEKQRVEGTVLKGKGHILLVDDEQQVLSVEKRLLEKLGYSVEAHGSAESALTRFREEPQCFDLVLTDMTMPKMTGDQLARELIRIRPDLPVIICTGYSRQLTEESVRAIGIKGLLYKPVELSQLAGTLNSALSESATQP